MNFQDALSHMQLQPGLRVKRDFWPSEVSLEVGDGKLFMVIGDTVIPVEHITSPAIMASDWSCIYNEAQAKAHIGDEQVGRANG